MIGYKGVVSQYDRDGHVAKIAILPDMAVSFTLPVCRHCGALEVGDIVAAMPFGEGFSDMAVVGVITEKAGEG